MRIAGIVLIGISALFLFMPSSGETLIFLSVISMAGGIFLVIFGPLLLVHTGPLTIGRILKIKKNTMGTTLTVQFKTIDGQQVITSVRTTLPQEFVWPGMPMPIQYYTKNPKKALIVLKDSEEINRIATEYLEKIENGPLVFGTLVSMNPTGAQMEGKPLIELILRFNTVEGQQVIASHCRPASDEQIHPETIFPLRYNPEDPEQIVTGFRDGDQDKATLHRALQEYMISNGRITQEEADMMDRGVAATGVILSAKPTGNIVNGHEEMALHVKVTRPDDGGTYDATTKKPIRQSALAFIQPGSVVDVHYMPENEENIVVGNKEDMTFAL
ncbi:MAG: hypothetical protein LBE22_08805 [Azoarcus sp.]|jgi:hypothetical protein|nr:hypothetical protein [Azoarcus sp.]